MKDSYITTDVLFVLKKRDLVSTNPTDWNYAGGNKNSSGLANSVKFVSDALVKAGINSKTFEAIDNNYIDAEVTRLNPKIVIIEALWVVPEKFEILINLHPNVKWVIRLHSEMSFLACEGMAMDWLSKLVNQHKNISVSSNSRRLISELESVFNKTISYMPNIYPVTNKSISIRDINGVINVGCFGAIRPLKNHLIQAVAAIQYAEQRGLKLRFHINSSRNELNGEPILTNLRGLFLTLDHELVEHKWLTHNKFIILLQTEIDLVMQVSFTETYNIVAADCVENNIPVVASKEVVFIPWYQQASPTSSVEILTAIGVALSFGKILRLKHQKNKLKNNATNALNVWIKYFKDNL